MIRERRTFRAHLSAWSFRVYVLYKEPAAQYTHTMLACYGIQETACFRKNRFAPGQQSKVVPMKYIHESRIACTPAAVFAFHQRPDALLAITPPWEQVAIVGEVPPIEPGKRVTLRTKIGPVPVTWIAEYTDEFEPGRLFTDRQISGPFAAWLHHHWFLEDGAGGTVLRDEVDYEAPLGMFGRWLGGGLILRKLEKMFTYRHQVTKRVLEENRI